MCAPVTVAGFVWANFNEKKNDNYFIPRRQGYQDQYQCSITTDGKMSEDRECNSKRKSELRGLEDKKRSYNSLTRGTNLCHCDRFEAISYNVSNH